MASIVDIAAVAGQTVFDLPFSYTPTSNELFVAWNGQLLYLGVQYLETSSTKVTLTFAAEAGDLFTFRVPVGVFSGFAAPTSFSFAPRIAAPTNPPTLVFVP